MKIATWNVNSIRVRLQSVLDWMDQARPDVLCLQETKVTDDLFPTASFRALGYHVTVSGQKTYNGVAIVSKHNMTEVSAEFPDYEAQEQKRFVAATVQQVRLINVYVPQGSSPDSPKFAYKLEFIRQLRNYLEQMHDPEELLIMTGDFNIAPEAGDVYDAEAMEGEIGYHPDERAALGELKKWGLRDVFRRHHKESGLFSWWDYRAGAFRRNMGLRIDHIYASLPLAVLSVDSGMDREQRSLPKPSDHIPVWATFNLGSLHQPA